MTQLGLFGAPKTGSGSENGKGAETTKTDRFGTGSGTDIIPKARSDGGGAVPDHQNRFRNRSISQYRSSSIDSDGYDRFRKVAPTGKESPEPVPTEQGPLAGERAVAVLLSPPAGQGACGLEPDGPGASPVSESGTDRNRSLQNSTDTAPSDPKPPSSGPKLRPYQAAAITAVEREFEQGRTRTLLVCATGTGKTVTFAEWIRRGVELGERSLVIAHRTELIEQAVRKLADVGIRASVDQGSSVGSRNAPVVVGSVQTLRGARLERHAPNAFRRVVVDEAHHSAAASYKAILARFASALVLGVTATPDRADGRALGEQYESVAFTYEMRTAIREKYLAPLRARRVLVSGLDLTSIKSHHGDFDQGELAQVLLAEKALHGVVSPLVQLAGDRKTLVFGVDVAHAKALAEVINRHKPGAAIALDGSAKDAERKAVLALFRRGSFQFLTNCLDDQTEILTKRGWRGIDDVDNDEVVATMNTATSAMEWQCIQRVIRRERADGEEMVTLSNQTLDIRVTGGHRMVVGVGAPRHWGIADAATLPVRRSSYELPTAAFGEPDHRVPLSLDECEFIGLWMADGHLDRVGYRGITIGQSARFDANNLAIERVLDACRFDWKRTTHKRPLSSHPQHRYRIPKGSIGKSLGRRGWVHLEQYLDKQLAPALMNLDRDQARALFAGLWLGDGVKFHGRKRRATSWHIVNTDKTLLDRLQILAVTRGFAANISPPRDNGPLATKPIYTLRIRDRASVRTNNHTVATSGGNPATFRLDHRDERVWCVTTANGTIITRRNGKAIVMGQCALFTEGFDEPSIECVALCRPTQSRGLHTQMIGRATRLSPETGKTDALILDFVGNSKHRLISPADALAGMVLDDATREAAEKQLDGQTELEDVLVHAEAEAARKRDAVKLIAVAVYRQKEIDVFLGDQMPKLEPSSPAFHRPATDKQLEAIEKAGLGKPPPGLSLGEASAMLDAVRERERLGLASVPQAKLLRKFGVDTKAVRFVRAGELIAILRMKKYVPWALRGEPEWSARKFA